MIFLYVKYTPSLIKILGDYTHGLESYEVVVFSGMGEVLSVANVPGDTSKRYTILASEDIHVNIIKVCYIFCSFYKTHYVVLSYILFITCFFCLNYLFKREKNLLLSYNLFFNCVNLDMIVYGITVSVF